MEFKDIENLKQLSGFLKTGENLLVLYLDEKKNIYDHIKPYDKEAFKNSCIEKFYIPKKNKKFGFRIVYSIKNETFKNINKVIFFCIRSKYQPLDCVQGFVKERSSFSNARMHMGKRKILNIDIKNFFESISKDKVFNVFLSLGFSKYIANILADLTTVEDKLVLGFNTSPIIANLAVKEMDEKFIELSGKNKCTYSRYADDISFSTNNLLPEVLDVEKILNDYGFNINERKTKIMTRGKSQYVTGLTVFDSISPRIPKKTKRKIRLLLYYYKKFGIFSHIMHVNNIKVNDVARDVVIFCKIEHLAIRLIYKIKGLIDYVNSVEPGLADMYYADYNLIGSDREIRAKILEKMNNAR